MDPKERAKLIIAEIIRQAGGTLENKTNLYKAFYYAHLKFAAMQPGYLSTWPIVRMPRGPGIHGADELLGELTAEGVLHVKQVRRRIRSKECFAFVFKLSRNAASTQSRLEPEAVAAIAEAVRLVQSRSAACVSEESHLQSRSWREAKDGDELAIYSDLIPDEEIEERRKSMEATASALMAAWKQPSK